MPDRAVVDDACGVTPLPHSWVSTGVDGPCACIRCGAVRPPFEMPPRALVAISEDRRAMVHLSPHEVKAWLCWGWDDIWDGTWKCEASIPDTGQDAHEVLAAWLEGRNDRR